MSLLTTSETRKLIAKEVAESNESLQIISAFCKINAVRFIDENISIHVKEKKLLVRFLLTDIINGVTDLELFEYCKANGWKLYVRFDLHAKTYVFDKKRCINGSANLTKKGLGLDTAGNAELSTFVELDNDDLIKIDTIFSSAILLTDELYLKMKQESEKQKKGVSDSVPYTRWSKEIENIFTPTIDALFTYDFPNTDYDPNCEQDMSFLNPLYDANKDFKQAFRWSKAYMWLYDYLLHCKNKTSYFGQITEALHSVLINDPKPYRKEVKALLSNFLSWIEYLDDENIIIDVPNHSQRIRIVEKIVV